MKKLLFISLAALAVLVGCSKNNDDDNINVLDKITDPVFNAYALFCMDNENEAYDPESDETETFPKWDANGDGILSKAEAAAVQAVGLFKGYDDAKVKNAAGIEYFTGAKVIDFDGNELTTLNVSGLAKLEFLYCYENDLTTLNVSDCAQLEGLYCSGNDLTTLNVSDCAQLEGLYCSGNDLTTLNVSGCAKLVKLDCFHNDLTTLNVSGCAKLVKLNCYDNDLSTLDVSDCAQLKYLYCDNNELTTLNVSGCAKLEVLYCLENDLTTLDVSSLTALKEIACGNGEANPMTVTVAAGTVLGTDLDVYAYDGGTMLISVENFGAPATYCVTVVEAGS
ncbi:hypothetical protein LJC45_01915 [Alistipes sp. OttesenSCG-928-B03]|nr:hypothetical protein [Alistipes sp. OttesenSCG-928-B03]